MVEIERMTHEHRPHSEYAYFFAYDDIYGTMLTMRRNEMETTLLKTDSNEQEVLDKRIHHDFMDALMWVVKWRYYT